MEIRDLRERTRELLQGPLRHVKTAGLAAALIPLGAIPAHATVMVEPVSVASSSVTPDGSNFDYAFTLRNVTPSLSVKTFELPLFSASDVIANSAQGPAGWSVSIVSATAANWNYNSATDPALTRNPTKYGANPSQFDSPAAVLVFTTSDGGSWIGTGVTSGTFSFSSQFGGTAAPGVAFFDDSSSTSVDPMIPNDQAVTPEPHTIVQAGIGSLVLVVAAGYRWLRSRLGAGVPS